ncbi:MULTISPECIES: hypothetical protein [Flammeovirga]|uniref:Uncharacterized protein n=1 Tax=Flammeovirga agarivorans TaxID=2726742 RepID=A0A7X8SHV0_9BACT|nr:MULTISPECIES: hypothetical protein [Flammeovirga]NLR90479.1 hypothetical protein [Flammeovirga agarivorans]
MKKIIILLAVLTLLVVDGESMYFFIHSTSNIEGFLSLLIVGTITTAAYLSLPLFKPHRD